MEHFAVYWAILRPLSIVGKDANVVVDVEDVYDRCFIVGGALALARWVGVRLRIIRSGT